MAKERIIARAFLAGAQAQKPLGIAARPKNPYKPGKYHEAFEAGARRMRERGTLRPPPALDRRVR